MRFLVSIISKRKFIKTDLTQQTYSNFNSKSLTISGDLGLLRNSNSNGTEEYISFLDDDDIWENNYLEEISKVEADLILAHPYNMRQRTLDQYKKILFNKAGIVYGSGLTIKRKVFNELNGFVAHLNTSEIWDLCLRAVLKEKKIIDMPNKLFSYTRSSDSISKITPIELIYKERELLLNKYGITNGI